MHTLLWRAAVPMLVLCCFSLIGGCGSGGEATVLSGDHTRDYPFELGKVQQTQMPPIVLQYAQSRRVEGQVYWKDGQGEHLGAKVSDSTEVGELRLVHALKPKDEPWRLADRLVDFMQDCGPAQFSCSQPQVEVTDLDEDQIGELWLGYELSCGAERQRKLLVWRGGKYGLRQLAQSAPISDIPEPYGDLQREAEEKWDAWFQ